MEPFDLAAASYDSEFTHSETGRRQRDIVHRYVAHDSFFRSPKYILEINCGTGEDALWLAGMEHHVTATDASPQMLEIAKRKKREAGNQPVFLKFDLLASEWTWPDQTFDVVFSDFAGLNCFAEDDLKRIFASIMRILKPGGRFILVMFGRHCITEIGYFSIKGRFRTAFRRMSKRRVDANVEGKTVPVYYHSASQIAAWLPGMRLKRKFAVGLFLPPSYLEPKAAKKHRLTRFLGALERLAFKRFIPASLGDHMLLDFEKKTA